MELAKYIACICEGAAESAIIDILVDHHLLIFQREDMLDEKVIRCRDGKTFETRYLRKGFSGKISVIRDINNYEVHYNFFDRHRVSVNVLRDLFVKQKAHISIADEFMEICCNKDTWRIPIKLKNGQAELLHNNYTRTFAGRRVMDSGYHEQILPRKTVEGALKYILEYDYEMFHG